MKLTKGLQISLYLACSTLALQGGVAVAADAETSSDGIKIDSKSMNLDIKDTGGVMTGTAFMVMAIKELRGKEADPLTVATYSAIGAGSILGGVSLVAHAGGIPATKEDPVRQFRTTALYNKLVEQLGKARAENFIADVEAGWSTDKVLLKYVNNEKDKAKLLAIFKEANDKAKAGPTTKPAVQDEGEQRAPAQGHE